MKHSLASLAHEGHWFLMSGAALVVLHLTPLMIRVRTPAWTVGWPSCWAASP